MNILKNKLNQIYLKLLQPPQWVDLLILSLLTLLITWHPHLHHTDLNVFEAGIYLPNITAILNGLIPYRDFFYLRGPFEIYAPSFLMYIFGENIFVLLAYFYIGTVVTTLIGIWIGKELYQTKFVLYLMVPIFVARTFLRVAVCTYWGGTRFGLGLLILLCALFFWKKRKYIWIYFAGTISSLALLTSIDVGISSTLSIVLTLGFAWIFNLTEKTFIKKTFKTFIIGMLTIAIPYCIYLISTQSFLPFIDSIFSVGTQMTKTFPDHLYEQHPQGLIQALAAMSPTSPHFDHLTPAYCYLFLGVYIFFLLHKKRLHMINLGLMTIAFYGALLFVLSFRKLGAAQFEMALQPEKIVLFFMLERTLLFLNNKRIQSKKWAISCYVLTFLFVGSSLGYSFTRFDRRFYAFKYLKKKLAQEDTRELLPLHDQPHREITNIESVKGLVIRKSQAEDIEQLTQFIKQNTLKNEPVFMFPELGTYSFIIDRPFVGRFPMATFSWIGKGWDKELFSDLKRIKPRYVITDKKLDPIFEKVYFKIPKNKRSFDEINQYIEEHYVIIDSTPSLFIYRRK